MKINQKVNNLYKIFICICFLSLNLENSFSEDKKKKDDKNLVKEKTYTQTEFDKAIKIEVKRRLSLLKDGEFVKFTNELFAKENKLKHEKSLIKKKEKLIVNSRVSLKKQIQDFHKEQKKYLSCRSDNSKKKDKRVLHMVDVISGMKPLTASKILSVQDANIAIDILSRLEAVKVSKIFNLMDKEISARLQKQYMTMQE